ncbi:MAG: hypothetical protein CL624_13910 [Arcobacter sp.]|nr:hypothetical protein [Arcobacter sp.]|tara:strand:+ start:396 stop:725 length:330 start_codon:yes stop_codon:yes gene_type:complete
MKVSFFIILISIAFLAFYPKDFISLDQGIPYEDKLKHIIAFFVLSFFFYKSFENFKNVYKFYFLVIFACAIEIVQSFVGREANILDFIASCFGILLYLLVSQVRKENIL